MSDVLESSPRHSAPERDSALEELASQQRRFSRAVTSAALPADPSVEGLLHGLSGRAPMLRVYRHAYGSRLASALRDNFGVLPQVMGDGAFEALAQAYVQAHPSQHPSIRWFGHRLPEFMAAREDLVAHPALIDLARMEWALRGAFDAADSPTLQATELAGVAPEAWADLVLFFHPSLKVLDLHWRVEPLWRALQGIDPGAEPDLPEPEAHAHQLLIWRPEFETRWRSALSDLESDLLRAALAGRTFGWLCEHAARQVGGARAVPAVVGVLQQWVAEGLLAGWR